MVKVAEFLAEHNKARLSIFTARLYHDCDPGFQHGLHRLQDKGARVQIMSSKGERLRPKECVGGRDSMRPGESGMPLGPCPRRACRD